MNYERKYKEALSIARECMKDGGISQNTIDYLCNIFPELKESEDERIRKSILSGLKYLETELGWDAVGDADISDAYAWLEKQGDKNSTDNVEPKFHEGDWVAYENLDTMKIMDINDDRYKVEFIDGHRGVPYIDFIDRNSHLWTIQDAKKGDVLASSDESIFIYAGSTDRHAKFYIALTKYGTFNFEGGIWEDKNAVHPATKEQRELLFQKMREAGYEWSEETYQLKKIEQNITCSEEDEQYLKGILYEIEANESEAPEYDYKTYDRYLAGIKLLNKE